MARQVQIIRGTTEQNNNFTGATGAMTYDTDTKGLRVHDGSTKGGVEVPTAAMADYVIYWDSADATDHSHAKPGVATPASGTWYRLYKSGWVEQGTTYPTNNSSAAGVKDFSFTFPIPMKSTAYTIGAGGPLTISEAGSRVVAKSTTAINAGSVVRGVACSNVVVFGWAA